MSLIKKNKQQKHTVGYSFTKKQSNHTVFPDKVARANEKLSRAVLLKREDNN